MSPVGVNKRRNGKWYAHIQSYYVNYNLGAYDTKEDAAAIREIAASISPEELPEWHEQFAKDSDLFQDKTAITIAEKLNDKERLMVIENPPKFSETKPWSGSSETKWYHTMVKEYNIPARITDKMIFREVANIQDTIENETEKEETIEKKQIEENKEITTEENILIEETIKKEHQLLTITEKYVLQINEENIAFNNAPVISNIDRKTLINTHVENKQGTYLVVIALDENSIPQAIQTYTIPKKNKLTSVINRINTIETKLQIKPVKYVIAYNTVTLKTIGGKLINNEIVSHHPVMTNTIVEFAETIKHVLDAKDLTLEDFLFINNEHFISLKEHNYI